MNIKKRTESSMFDQLDYWVEKITPQIFEFINWILLVGVLKFAFEKNNNWMVGFFYFISTIFLLLNYSAKIYKYEYYLFKNEKNNQIINLLATIFIPIILCNFGLTIIKELISALKGL